MFNLKKSICCKKFTGHLSDDCIGQQKSYMLLVKGTSSGKSTVPQTVGFITCNVTLVLENTLSLGADLQSNFSRESQNYTPFIAYQIDSIKDQAEISSLSTMLLELPCNTNASMFIYLSP